MNILQISAPKSGSYWLHTILHQILQKKDIPMKSFIQQQEIYQHAKNLELSFKDQAAVDMMDIEQDDCYYRISSVFREKLPDPAAYANSTSLAWTHSTLCTMSFDILPLFTKRICIVRDPRDRALSAAKFAFTPYMKKHYPSPYSSPEEFIQNEYANLLERWVWFYGNYLLHKEELDIHIVFYERLLHDFPAELKSLLNYLQVSLSEEQQKEIEEAVTFSNMKNKSPKHLNKGKFGKWMEQLSEEQKKLAIEKAGGLMQHLNYPLKIIEGQEKLPSLTSDIPQNKLKEMLQDISWYELYNSNSL
ncbi:sulfotransferase domain-containing protein [Salegentibacter sp. F188]|uniref:Sulfotransferase domain-containing protein n=1 Tax=Autumnicola patrickiae TaxID=3075591 RepID=A0ABU3E038_9FLAO|nr:sulfotransferase domain-containing protein [Salegentibacter sp. F188]MDT0689341.1 sulfotransferase domain-containing protein [Salegentibacter sp. F188]